MSSACSLPRRQHIAAQRVDQRLEQRGGPADPVGQGRAVELHALAGVDAAPADTAAGGRRTWPPAPGPAAPGRPGRARSAATAPAPARCAGTCAQASLGRTCRITLKCAGHVLEHLGDVLAELAHRRRRSRGRCSSPARARSSRAAGARAAADAPALLLRGLRRPACSAARARGCAVGFAALRAASSSWPICGVELLARSGRTAARRERRRSAA